MLFEECFLIGMPIGLFIVYGAFLLGYLFGKRGIESNNVQ